MSKRSQIAVLAAISLWARPIAHSTPSGMETTKYTLADRGTVDNTPPDVAFLIDY